MDDKTEKLIRELADKFGTTADHLWKVLVHQATISGLTNLFACTFWIGMCVAARFYIKRASKKRDGNKPTLQDEALNLAWISWWIFIAIVVLIVGLCMEDCVVAPLVNPEYWALKQLIH